VDGRLFRTATPSGTWLSGQPATSGRDLGLEVGWLDDPNPNLGGNTLTLTAVAK
jgi:hypothetical protein